MRGLVKIACLSAALAVALVTATENRDPPGGRRSSKGDRLDVNKPVDGRKASRPKWTVFAAGSPDAEFQPGRVAVTAEGRDVERFLAVPGRMPDPL
ncbi:hypothetical protein [uncultured Enterovirga sp.]|uniref:hypothetical protein n=1 Tax=uncultured Enterovirga sp. TaxID=2026352 RepID=UPI0035C98254